MGGKESLLGRLPPLFGSDYLALGLEKLLSFLSLLLRPHHSLRNEISLAFNLYFILLLYHFPLKLVRTSKKALIYQKLLLGKCLNGKNNQ